MSYSRWSNSVWYTFWCTTESPYREDQLFDVCAVKSFTYKELTEDIKGCLDIIYKIAQENFKDGCTKKQLKELKGYMKAFIADVKADKSLDEADLVRDTPKEDLPLLVGRLKFKETIQLLAERLREE